MEKTKMKSNFTVEEMVKCITEREMEALNHHFKRSEEKYPLVLEGVVNINGKPFNAVEFVDKKTYKEIKTEWNATPAEKK